MRTRNNIFYSLQAFCHESEQFYRWIEIARMYTLHDFPQNLPTEEIDCYNISEFPYVTDIRKSIDHIILRKKIKNKNEIDWRTSKRILKCAIDCIPRALTERIFPHFICNDDNSVFSRKKQKRSKWNLMCLRRRLYCSQHTSVNSEKQLRNQFSLYMPVRMLIYVGLNSVHWHERD